jgi:hypothetical protein
MSTAADIRRALIALPSGDRASDVARSLLAGDTDVRDAVLGANACESGLTIADWLMLKHGSYLHRGIPKTQRSYNQ